MRDVEAIIVGIPTMIASEVAATILPWLAVAMG